MLISHSNTLQPLLVQDHIQKRSKIIEDPGSIWQNQKQGGEEEEDEDGSYFNLPQRF